MTRDTKLLQPCSGDPTLLTPCASDPRLLTPCYDATCWTVATVTFAKDPGAISFACIGCAAPGVAFSHFSTSAADGSDLAVLIPCLDMPFTICAGTFFIPFTLSTMSWQVIVDDPTHQIYCYVRKSQNARYKQGGCPAIAVCADGDYHTDPTSGPCAQATQAPEMGLPHVFADPGGPSRFTTCNGTVPVQGCGGTTFCVTPGGTGVQATCSSPPGPGEGGVGCPVFGAGPS